MRESVRAWEAIFHAEEELFEASAENEQHVCAIIRSPDVSGDTEK